MKKNVNIKSGTIPNFVLLDRNQDVPNFNNHISVKKMQTLFTDKVSSNIELRKLSVDDKKRDLEFEMSKILANIGLF